MADYSIRSFDKEVDVIAQLSDLPNDSDGLTADELKARFDHVGTILKEYINSVLIPDIITAINAAIIGVKPGEGIGTNMIEDNAITFLKLNRTAGGEAVNTGAIRDGAVTTEKLANGSVTSVKIARGAVTAEQLAGNIDGTKLANSCVGSRHYQSGSVTQDKLSQTEGQEAVVTNAIRNGAVTNAKVADNTLNIAKMDGTVQAKHKTATVTLAGGQTSWSVANVPGVTASNAVVATPAPQSYDTWGNYGVRCTGQSANTLTFTANAAPNTDVVVNILILD